jgi:hypothetical protein
VPLVAPFSAILSDVSALGVITIVSVDVRHDITVSTKVVDAVNVYATFVIDPVTVVV